MKHNFNENYTKILQKVEKFPQIEKKNRDLHELDNFKQIFFSNTISKLR